MKRYLVTTLFMSALAAPVAAQQSGGQPNQTGGVSGKAGFGYLATRGNTESTNANASFELVYDRMSWSHEFGLSAVNASRDEVTTAEAYTAEYQARRSYGERTYLFTAFDWRSDRFSAYDHKTSETVGYGRRILDSERHELNLEGGVGARQAERQSGLDEDDRIARLALDYTLTLDERTEFSQEIVTESGSTNTSVESITALRLQIIGDIGLALSHRIRRNSDVEPGTRKTDQFTSISLEYEF